MLPEGEKLRSAERAAKAAKVGQWKNYVPPPSNQTRLSGKFTGHVVEVVSGDCLIVCDKASRKHSALFLPPSSSPALLAILLLAFFFLVLLLPVLLPHLVLAFPHHPHSRVIHRPRSSAIFAYCVLPVRQNRMPLHPHIDDTKP